jgi:hypothetical protein
VINQPSKVRAASLGGLALGAASAAPVINIANCACCSLAVLGGFLAAYLYLKNLPPSPEPPWGDVAVVGLLAGVIGAVVTAILSLPIAFLGSSLGMWSALQEAFSDASMPPELRNLFATLGSGTLAVGIVLVSFVFNLFVFALFATLGALLGAATLHRKPATMTPV